MGFEGTGRAAASSMVCSSQTPQPLPQAADVCGCNPDPQLGRSGPIADAPAAAEAQGAEPRVRAFDAVTALTAARSPSVAWDWECCAVKPARPESIGEEQEA